MAQFFDIHPENPQARLLKQAATLLQQGGVLAVPTDSSYALVCQLDDKNAVDKLRRIRNLTDGSEKPLGEWNTMRIECFGDRVDVWVNGDLVNSGHNATAGSGQIAVQAEGSEVEFRKLQLTPITEPSLKK